MCTESINLQYKTIFPSFGQNTAEFYDKHVLLTVLCIFWQAFGLKFFCIASNEKWKSCLNVGAMLSYAISTQPNSDKIIKIMIKRI